MSSSIKAGGFLLTVELLAEMTLQLVLWDAVLVILFSSIRVTSEVGQHQGGLLPPVTHRDSKS